MSSPAVTNYTLRTHWEHARHGGFQIFDIEHRTDSRRPLDQTPGIMTETNEGEDRRSQDEELLTLETSELAAPLQLTTPQNEQRTW